MEKLKKNERLNVANLFVATKKAFVTIKKLSLKEDIYWHVATCITLVTMKVLVTTKRLFIVRTVRMEKMHGLGYIVTKRRNVDK